MIEISVVVPCRNESGTLGACLGALLAQDLPRSRYEVVLVDGGSTDGCPDMARAQGVRVLRDEGSGPAGARNVGVAAAKGAIVAFTDADCIPARDWLSSILRTFQEDPGLVGVAGALRMPQASLIGRMEDMDARVHYAGYITSNVAYRRSALLAVDGFDERLCCAEDYDLAWRLLENGARIARDPRPIVVHDPPEIHGSVGAYLRKQVWYARNDIPALVLALRRTTKPWGNARSAMMNAGWTAAVVGFPVFPRIAAAALVGGAFSTTRGIVRTTRAAGLTLREAPQMAAIALAKKLARGIGTTLGLVDLLRTPVASASAPAPWDEAPLRLRARAG